jgi:Peptidase C13 family
MRCTHPGRRLSATLIVFVLSFVPLVAPAAPLELAPKLAVVSFGLFGDQDVFRSEATGAAAVVANRFGAAASMVRFNTRKTADATVETLAGALQAAAAKIEAQRDVLFVILASHGSREGLVVTSGRPGILTPANLTRMLDRTGVQRKVVIISACYSGIFIPRLADANTLVITAADANHPSFGCQDKAKWTYFGDAFFNQALRRTNTLRNAFAQASSLILKRELQSGFEPSHPQIAGGENVEPLLVARRQP